MKAGTGARAGLVIAAVVAVTGVATLAWNIVSSRQQQCFSNPSQCNEDELIAEAEKFKDTPPQGDGPWSFIVIETADLGLKIRSTSDKSGHQVGTIVNGGMAWVTCKVTSDFDPEPNLGVGPLWYAVKWPSNEPSMAFSNSEPAAKFTQWAYGAYLLPLGHNGAVPNC